MKIDKGTGEVLSEELDPPAKIKTGKRADGSIYWEQDFTGCISKTEPHHEKDTDINYLVTKYRPDELAAYLVARNPRQPIYHDFTLEPDGQESRNIAYTLKQRFEKLPESLQNLFGSPLELLKFADNPDNMSALQQLGLFREQKLKQEQNNEQTQTNDKTQNQKTQNSEAPAPQGAT